MSRTLLARAVGLALLVALGAAARADAAPTWLAEASPFGNAPSRQTDARTAMAPDGTIVFARFAPDGALEVRERPPGGPVGETITLPPVSAEPQTFPNLQVLVGMDGTAAVLFDVGNFQFGSLRARGGTWTAPDVVGLAGADARQAAISPAGELWILGRDPGAAEGLAVFQTTPTRPVQVTPLPKPPAGSHHIAGALTTPSAGGARVVYLEDTVVTDGDDCTRTTAMVEVDVAEQGEARRTSTLDNVAGAGTSTANGCALESGAAMRDPLLATDGGDADTAVYTMLTIAGFEVTVRARHRDNGGAWPARVRPAEVVGGADFVAERVLGGSGLPLVVLRGVEEKSVSSRRPGGVWTTPEKVIGVEGASSQEVARTGRGTTVFAWIQGGNARFIFGRVVGADGTLGARETLAEAGIADTMLSVSGDFEGNAVALYSKGVGDGLQLRMNGYDAAGPHLEELSVPARGSVGEEVRFAVSGLDVWSGPLRTAGWDFGDGGGANGLEVGHAYASGGLREVTVRAEDESGNATTASQPLRITGDATPPSPTPSPGSEPSPAPEPAPAPAPSLSPVPDPVETPTRDTRAPLLSGLSINPKAPRPSRAPALVLTTDEAGTLDVTLAGVASGVKRGGRCVARSSRRGGKPCTRTLKRITGTQPLIAGSQRVKLPRLAAGKWTVTATVTDAAGNRSTRSRLTVRVA